MKQQLNEIKRMQQLAGILKENQEYGGWGSDIERYQNSNEMGWMEVTMEDIAEKQDLDLKYIPDLEIAFNEALARLRNDHPELDFDDIINHKEIFFK